MAEQSTARLAPTARRVANPGRLTVGQMAVVGTAAALFLRGTTSGPWVLFALFVGVHAVLLAGVAALLTVTYLLGTLTRHGSRLTESPGIRCGWTLLVWAGGAALVGYGRAALGHLGFDPDQHPEAGHWLLGLGAALVVGVFGRSRQVRIVSGALIALFVVVTAALRALD
ncbi:hypothetical protein V6U77_03170 [Micromonospora sp. CPCC 205546]|uniref:hypothetical protein n=1 Tax=Micromonospora sp. CPCC 205546 TaxID=3122397 RepID=UPI002FF23C47